MTGVLKLFGILFAMVAVNWALFFMQLRYLAGCRRRNALGLRII